MLKVGCVLLSVWVAFNGLLATAIFLAVGLLHNNAPALTILFKAEEVSGIEPRALFTINALAVLFNACAACVCGLALWLIWSGVWRRARHATWAVGGALSVVQGAGFLSDRWLGSLNLWPNLASTALLGAGLVCVVAGQRAR